ncbi:hypothetical protein GF357_01750 [Candidatus Dojkabacteria bacterium]|nr:hypothetical protein [Candidatus Dojkabacteria bacterium]
MKIINQIILAIVQATTELLPISSTGHLLLASQILKNPIDQHYLSYLHFWTALALLTYYSPKILKNLKSAAGRKLLINIGLATLIPAAAGAILADKIEAIFYNPVSIALALSCWGIVMIFVFSKHKSKNTAALNDKTDKDETENEMTQKDPKNSAMKISETGSNHQAKFSHDTQTDNKSLSELSLKKILLIGASQILAMIPGTSRSGVTLISSSLLGLDWRSALDLSFLLAIPITLGAFLKALVFDFSQVKVYFSGGYILSGIICFGLCVLVLYLMRRIKSGGSMLFFAVYRILIGIVILLTIGVD